jgi:hypothetical protein
MKWGSATYYDVSDTTIRAAAMTVFDPARAALLRSDRVFHAIPCGWPDLVDDRVVVLALVCLYSLKRIASNRTRAHEGHGLFSLKAEEAFFSFWAKGLRE